MALAELWRTKFTLFTRENRPPPDAPGPEPAPPDTPGRVSSLALLAPTFRTAVIGMVADLREAGWHPVVWETYRSDARARFLQRKGSSKNGALSLHRYEAAVDVICGEHYWACHEHGCDFFEALGAAAKARGAYWGGDLFPRNPITRRRFVDKPHVQAVPYREQSALRAANSTEAYLVQRALEAP